MQIVCNDRGGLFGSGFTVKFIWKNIPLFIFYLFLIDLAIPLAYLLNHYVGEPSYTITNLLDLDGEGNLPSWYSTIQLFLVSLLTGVFAARNFDRSRMDAWFLILFPMVFLLLSLDETAQIHESLGKISDVLLPGGSRKGTAFGGTGIWVFLLGVPFTVGFFFLLYSIRGYFIRVPRALGKFIVGISIFLFGATMLELLSNISVGQHDFSSIQIFSEELFEMIGETVMVWAAYDLLVAYGFTLRGPDRT